jgi:hypothetical protein
MMIFGVCFILYLITLSAVKGFLQLIYPRDLSRVLLPMGKFAYLIFDIYLHVHFWVIGYVLIQLRASHSILKKTTSVFGTHFAILVHIY